MSQLREKLKQIIPRMSVEANQLRAPETRARWMQLKQITMSTKSLSHACRFYGVSEDWYRKWGKRLAVRPRVIALESKSKKPHRSPNKTKPRVEKKVISLRAAEPAYGPERIANDAERVFKIKVAVSTVYAILKRAKLISQKFSKSLTKRHWRRYRRPLPGYLQMDFKYVPYLVEARKYYQLSVVDHHSSWRLIRIYEYKNLVSVTEFLKELKELCPFPIMEIQTDNDAAFTDKFSSQRGVTGTHPMDIWCKQNDLVHRLIPVGVKELNGKVENTHKQDDREFYSKGPYKNLKQLQRNATGYNERWNQIRRTKSLGFKTPYEVVDDAFVMAVAYLNFIKSTGHKEAYKVDINGTTYLELKGQKPKKKIKTRKKTAVEKYLQYLEWEDRQKKNLPALISIPTMTQSFPRRPC